MRRRVLALRPRSCPGSSPVRAWHAIGSVAALALLATLDPSPAAAQAPSRQTQADDYTRYELLEPASHAFRILYEVTATTPGSKAFFNGLRAGSEHRIDAVYDRSTGDSLRWSVVGGDVARGEGLPWAGDGDRYLRVELARPVPQGGEARLLIDKTYTDTATYFMDGSELVWKRSLGIDRNAVVLPAGWELRSVNFPSQVSVESDGRIRVSFMNAGPAAVPYEVHAARLPAATASARARAAASPARSTSSDTGAPAREATEGPGPSTAARVGWSFPERARQDREIVYFLRQPETHAFDLYHDYTESRPGVSHYFNVVRPGSRSSEPSAVDLDTGEKLDVATLSGAELAARGLDAGEPIEPDAEVVVITFPAVRPDGSTRLRISETYTDPSRYVLTGDELVWDRSFGRPRNGVVLPDGWYLTASSIPARVRTRGDGRVELELWNPRPDDIRVFVRARRR